MKKMICLLVAVFSFASAASAKLITLRPGMNAAPAFLPTKSETEFDVTYYVPKTIVPYKVPEDVNLYFPVTQAFKTVNDGCEGEIRYSLFTENNVGYRTWKEDISKFAYEQILKIVCTGPLYNLVEWDVNKEKEDSTVYKVFNGDLACMTFIHEADSPYSKGFKYMYVEFMYKLDQGLVMRTFLANDLKFFGMKSLTSKKISPESDFAKNYNSFRFMDKNKDGTYIKP